MVDEIHVGDIGTILRVTIKDGATAVDISSATTKQILIYKPSGTTLTKSANFVTDGTDGKMQYVTIAGDLDEQGTYRIQAYIVMSGWTGHSDQATFEAHANL